LASYTKAVENEVDKVQSQTGWIDPTMTNGVNMWRWGVGFAGYELPKRGVVKNHREFLKKFRNVSFEAVDLFRRQHSSPGGKR
jgi:hypothetical protein